MPDLLVNDSTAALDAQLAVNVGYIGSMQERTNDCCYQKGSHSREQNFSSVDPGIQEVVQGGACTHAQESQHGQVLSCYFLSV